MSTKKSKIKNLKKEVKFIDTTLVGIFIFLFVFVAVCLYIVYTTSIEPSSLIISVFGFCGLECGLLASITKRKNTIKKEAEKLLNSDTSKVCDTNENIEQFPSEQDCDYYSSDYIDNGSDYYGNNNDTYFNHSDNTSYYSSGQQYSYLNTEELLDATFLTPIYFEDME